MGRPRNPRRLGIALGKHRSGDSDDAPFPPLHPCSPQMHSLFLAFVAFSFVVRSIFLSLESTHINLGKLVRPTHQPLDTAAKSQSHTGQLHGHSFVTGQPQHPSSVTPQSQGHSLVTGQSQGQNSGTALFPGTKSNTVAALNRAEEGSSTSSSTSSSSSSPRTVTTIPENRGGLDNSKATLDSTQLKDSTTGPQSHLNRGSVSTGDQGLQTPLVQGGSSNNKGTLGGPSNTGTTATETTDEALDEDMLQDLAFQQHQSSMESRVSFSRAESRQVAKGCAPEKKPVLDKWLPKEGKYLLAYCTLYGLSNRMYCNQHALILAAKLNRTLIVLPRDPCDVSTDKERSLEPLAHVPYLRECLMTANLPGAASLFPGERIESSDDAGTGIAEAMRFQVHRKAATAHKVGLWVVSLQEFQSLQNSGAHANPLDVVVPWCHMGCPTQQCNANGALNIIKKEVKIPWIPPRDSVFKRAIKINTSWIEKFGEATADVDILSVGDTYFWDVEPYGLTYSGSLGRVFGSTCSLLLRPSPLVMKRAEDFKNKTLQNKPYAAVYLRLGDDFRRVSQKRGWNFWTVEDATKCLVPKLVRSGVKQVFVATDRFDVMAVFEDFLLRQDVKMVVFGPSTGLTGIEVIAIEKLLCAHASVFFYTEHATFALHVKEMRAGLGVHACEDEPYCESQTKRTL